MQTGSRLARAAYVMFAVVVMLALVKLSGLSGARPFFLKVVPAAPVAKTAQEATGGREAPGGEALDLPDADACGTADRPLTVGSEASSLPGRKDSARTEKPRSHETPVFYRPSSGEGVDGEPVCGNLDDFPESSRVVFPLPEDYFGSYEDTWGAARPQGGHEGTDLMSPTGTPEYAIIDGTVVAVKGANENGWNRLGGYTLMLEAAYDAGPIEAGDLFYYAHMEEESALKVGTKVRAGQRIGVVGDTGEGREATRCKFPPHLHFGWYDGGFADSRTNLEYGAMNPYPLLVWLEEYGGSVAGGMDASYCEAPPDEPAPNSSGTTPDLDTGDPDDARPSPVVEQNRDGQITPKPERDDRAEEEDEETNEKGKNTGATGDGKKESPFGSSAKEAEVGNKRGEKLTTPAAVTSAPDGDRTSGSSTGEPTDASTEDSQPQAEIRADTRPLQMGSSLLAPASRRYYVSTLMNALRKDEKNGRDGRDAGAPDKKKQTDKVKRKKPGKSPGRKEPQKPRSGETATQNRQPAVEGTKPAKKDQKESPDTTEPEARKPSEGGSR